MLKEIHNCREDNQRINFEKEQKRLKEYQDKLAFKLEV